MTPEEAARLEALMRAEDSAYMRDFVAFAEPGALGRQSRESRQDRFLSLHAGAELAGFFCLRGLDAGYSRPAFGVYVASRFAGRGLGRFAVAQALDLCREMGVERIMLKVAPGNRVARALYEDAGFRACGLCDDTGHQMMEKTVGNG